MTLMTAVLCALLAISLCANVVLALRVMRMRQQQPCGRPNPLPEIRPDFERIKAILSEELAKPELSIFFAMKNFNQKNWLCRAEIIERPECSRTEAYHHVNALVQRMLEACAIPGRIAGWVCDPNDSRKMIGWTIEFGYSHETGYAIPNEFDYRA